MKNYALLLLVLTSVLPFTLSAQTEVYGEQSGTWTKAKSPYVLTGAVTIPEGKTLTIEAGVKVGIPYSTQIDVYGKLIAAGTKTDSVHFSAIYNDVYGYAGNVNFQQGSAGSSLQYVSMDSMGLQTANGPMMLVRGSLTISHSSFNNSFTGLQIETSQVQLSDNTFDAPTAYGNSIYIARDTVAPTIQNCLFSGNEYARTISSVSALMTNVQKNTDVIIDINASSHSNATWPKQTGNSFYHLTYLSIDHNTILAINPGVKVVFTNYYSYINVYGSLLAVGQQQDSIRFSGTLNNGGYGYGGTINIYPGSTGSVIQYAVMDSMGNQTNNGPLALVQGALSISNSSVRNFYAGIQVEGSDFQLLNSTVSAATVTNNAIYIVRDTIRPSIQNCRFSGSDYAKVISSNSVLLDSVKGNTGAIIDLNGTCHINALLPKQASGSFYRVFYLGVDHGTTLTLQPGVKMVFSNYYTSIIVNGTLKALGTQLDSIGFYGVMNNGAYGYGGSIRFESGSSGSVLQYAILDSMGDQTNNGPLLTASGSVRINNSSIRNFYAGIQVEVSDFHLVNSSIGANNAFNNAVYIKSDTLRPFIQNCLFTGNDYARTIYANSVLMTNIKGNAGAIIGLNGTSHVDASLPKQGLNSFYLVDYLGIEAGTTLTVQPGVKIVFPNYYSSIVVGGALKAIGTAQDSIRFSGIYNNNDYRYGGNINFLPGSGGSVMQFAVLDSMGTEVNNGPLALVRGGLHIGNSSIRNFYYGIQADVSDFALNNCTVSSAEMAGPAIYVSKDTVTPTIQQCSFAGSDIARTVQLNTAMLTNIANNQNAILDINGTVRQDATWAKQGSNSFYQLNNVSVDAGATLTIKPGVRVMFPYYYSRLNVAGTLIANGTTVDSVYISGKQVGGPYGTTVESGGSISFLAGSSGSSIQYARLDSLSDPYDGAPAILAEGPVNISNVVFTQFRSEAVRLKNTNTTIDNVKFTSVTAQSFAIYIPNDTITPVVRNCSFTGDYYTRSIVGSLRNLINFSNNNNAILQVQSASFDVNYTLRFPGTNTYYYASGLSVPANVSVTIEPGVEIDFATNSETNIYGVIKAVGTQNAPIRFTNTDGNTPNRISMQENSSGIFSNVIFSRFICGLSINSDKDITLSNLLFQENTDGLQIYAGHPTIIASTFTNNDNGARILGGTASFKNCDILQNRSYGISNSTYVSADATSCWWGDVSGPYHSTANPSGLGNKVSDYVAFDPWAKKPAGNLVNDIGVTAIITPFSDCHLTDTEVVKIKVTNFGNMSQTGFKVAYKLDSNQPVVENVEGLNLPAGATADFTFATRVNLSKTNTTYNLRTFTVLPGDSIPTNDTLLTQVMHYGVLAAPSNLLPANNSVNVDKPVNFSWSAVTNADTYNLYVWPKNGDVPGTPTVSGISQVNYAANDDWLQYGQGYQWKVEAAKFSCATASAVQNFTIRKLPDVAVASISVPSTAVSETDLNFSWTVKNVGTGSTNTQWADAVYLSDAPVLGFGNDYFIGAYNNISALAAGQQYTAANTSYRIPQGFQGRYYLIIRTNAYQSMTEATDTNNVKTSTVDITIAPPPDLHIETLTVSPTTSFSEDSLTVNWNVKNNGTGPTTADVWSDGVYLSKDSVLDLSNAIQLASVGHTGALPVGGNYNNSLRVKLPQNIQGGYYILVQTDAGNSVFESAYDNNNTAVSQPLTIILRTAPNLVAYNVLPAADTVSAGGQINLSWNIKNEGAVTVPDDFSDAVYVSGGQSFDNSAQLLAVVPQQSPLASLAVRNAAAAVQVPVSLNQGLYYFYIKTDAYNNVNEYPAEDDNISTASKKVFVALPDLSVTAVQPPGSAFSGKPITFGYTVANSGLGNLLSGSWQDAVYLSTDSMFDGEDLMLTTLDNSTLLLRNGTYTRQATVQIPADKSGKYYLLVWANRYGTIHENDDGNNIKGKAVSIQLSPWPDLKGGSINVAGTATAGTTMHVSYTTTNNGQGTITGQSWRDDLVLSPTTSPDDPSRITLGSVTQQTVLAPGQNFATSADYTLPSTLPSGNYYVIISLNAGHDIFENTATANNQLVSTVVNVLPLPNIDLAVTTGNLNTAAIKAGGTVTATYTVKNAGATATLPGDWTDGIYLSNNAVLDAADRLLGSWQVGQPLNPAGAYTLTKQVVIPADADGTQYLLVVTDINNAQNDIARGNNYYALNTGSGGVITITQPSPVDLQPISLQAPATVLAGQPVDITFTVKNNGPGTSFADNWTDYVYLTKDMAAASGNPQNNISHTGTLITNNTYSITSRLYVPAEFAGNYLVAVNANGDHRQYELNGSQNNIITSGIIVKPMDPCDLAVDSVTVPAGTQVAGQPVTISYRLKNTGVNPANGFFRDAVYLSLDSVFNSEKDILLGTVEGYDNILPGNLLTRQLATSLKNVTLGRYYIIVRTDILGNIAETNENDNETISRATMLVDVKKLLIGSKVKDTLANNSNLYYRIDVTAAQAGETLGINLEGDSVHNAVNHLYMKFAMVPSPNSFDFTSAIAFSANQQVVIPSLQAGTYYVLAQGIDTANQQQPVTLAASIIPFSVTAVEAKKGGNTGNVTVIIRGAKFEADNAVRLLKNGTSFPASKIWFVNSSMLYATFPLSGAAIGLYDVNVKKANGDSASLVKGFEVVQGSPGGAEGANSFTCTIQNIGFENNLSNEAYYPASVLINRSVVITIAYANTGNVDIELPRRFMVSLGGAPVSFSPDLSENLQKLLLEYKELNGPQDILRAGASGAIKIYSKAVAVGSLRFVITE